MRTNDLKKKTSIESRIEPICKLIIFSLLKIIEIVTEFNFFFISSLQKLLTFKCVFFRNINAIKPWNMCLSTKTQCDLNFLVFSSWNKNRFATGRGRVQWEIWIFETDLWRGTPHRRPLHEGGQGWDGSQCLQGNGLQHKVS